MDTLMLVTSVTSVPGDWDYSYFRENKPRGQQLAGARPELPPQGKADSSLSLTAAPGESPCSAGPVHPVPLKPQGGGRCGLLPASCARPTLDLGWELPSDPKCEPGLTSAIYPTHAPAGQQHQVPSTQWGGEGILDQSPQ